MPGVETIVAFAKGLIALRAIAANGGVSENLESIAELSASREVIAGLVPRTDLSILARDMVERAKAAERRPDSTGGALSDERKLFDQALPYALQAPGLMTGAMVDPKDAIKRMLSEIHASPLQGAWTDAAESYFKRIARAALDALAENDEAVENSLPELFGSLLSSQARLEAELLSFRQEAKEGREKLTTLVSQILACVSDQSGQMSLKAIVAIAEASARRSPANPTLAMRSASEIIRAFDAHRSGHPAGGRAEQLTMFGALGLAASEADELARKASTDAERAEALDGAALQYLIALDFKAAAARIERRALLCRGTTPPSQALVDEFRAWYERGVTTGHMIYVEVAEAVAWLSSMHSPLDEKWRHLTNLGVANYALASSWGPIRLLSAQAAMEEALKRIPRTEREASLIKANLGAIYQCLARELGSPSLFSASLSCFQAAETELKARGGDIMLPAVSQAAWAMAEAREIMARLAAERTGSA